MGDEALDVSVGGCSAGGGVAGGQGGHHRHRVVGQGFERRVDQAGVVLELRGCGDQHDRLVRVL
jgi:hypothetical protein